MAKSPPPISLEELLRARRVQAEMTSLDAAELLGVSRSTYWQWETRARVAKVRDLRAIAEWLGLAPERVLPLVPEGDEDEDEIDEEDE